MKFLAYIKITKTWPWKNTLFPLTKLSILTIVLDLSLYNPRRCPAAQKDSRRGRSCGLCNINRDTKREGCIEGATTVGDGSSGSYSSWGLTMVGVVETGRLCPPRRPPNYVERHQNQLGLVIGKLFVLSQIVPTTDGYVQFCRWTILWPAIIGRSNKIIDHPRPKSLDRTTDTWTQGMMKYLTTHC